MQVCLLHGFQTEILGQIVDGKRVNDRAGCEGAKIEWRKRILCGAGAGRGWCDCVSRQSAMVVREIERGAVAVVHSFLGGMGVDDLPDGMQDPFYSFLVRDLFGRKSNSTKTRLANQQSERSVTRENHAMV